MPPNRRRIWSAPGQAAALAWARRRAWTDESTTLRITEQRGPVFTETKVYGVGEEAVFGTVRADGRTLLVADDGDGQAVGTVLGPGSIEYCYLEGGADAQAHCRVLTRSR